MKSIRRWTQMRDNGLEIADDADLTDNDRTF